MREKLLISFSGSRTSAYMTQWLLKNRQQQFDMLVVFPNTGKEREETLTFIDQCDKYFGFRVHWIEAVTNLERGVGVSARLVDYQTASRKGEPFEAFIQKHGIPNVGAPKCYRELKAAAIRAYAHSIGWAKYYTAIGIRADEPDRVDMKMARKERVIYPLAHMIRANKSDINLFWSKQPFDLALKSYEVNCDLCWKKSLRKLMTIVKDIPTLAEWWQEMENKYGTFIPPASRNNNNIRLPVRFYRDYMSIGDIAEESKFNHSPAVDETKIIDPYKQLDCFDEEHGNGAESCEAYG